MSDQSKRRITRLLLTLVAVVAIVLTFVATASANPADPFLNDPTPQPVPTGSVPDNGFQGWGAFEFSVPTIGGSYDTSTTYVNHWYAIGIWGNSPTDGRGALYADMFDNASHLYIDANDSVWLSGLDSEFKQQYGSSTYDSASGAWKLFDYTYYDFVNPHPQWISILDSHAGTQPAEPLPTNLQDNNPQYLATADGESTSLYGVEYYPANNYDIFNPTNGIYQGNGLSTGWFANWVFTAPDIGITVDPGNAGQPVPAGQTVTGTWTVTNYSDMEWQGNEVQLYLADSAGNILRTLGTIGGSGGSIDLGPAGSSNDSASGTFTWTIPTNQPNDVEVAGSVNELLSTTLAPGPANGNHVTLTSPNDNSPYNNSLAAVETNADSKWSNNLQIIPVPLASSGSGTTPALTVTPTSQTIPVGGIASYQAWYWPSGLGGSKTEVTTQSTWSTGNTIASDYGGDHTGQVYGVAAGTTGVTAAYSGLEASATINVTQATGYNIKVTSVTAAPAGTAVQPGQSYQATVMFNSTFPTGGEVRVDWYQQDDSGQWNGIGTHTITIAGNSTNNTDTIQWQFPASGTSTVTIQATVDDPFGIPTSSPVYQNLAFPVTSGGQPNESTYSDNYDQQSVAYQSNSIVGTGNWASGYATIPLEKTVQETKTYSVTPRGVQVPIINGPNQTWGPPHFYLSY